MPKNLKKSAFEKRRKRTKSKLLSDNIKWKVVVYRSNMHSYAQLIDKEKGNTLASASDLKIKNGTIMEKAYAIGQNLAKKALEKNITEIIFDRQGYKYHGRVKKIAEGLREGGLKL